MSSINHFSVLKRTFIIAEVGVNHNGDVDLAKRLIYEAKRTGADAVKLQTVDVEKNYVQGTHARNVFKTHVTYRWNAGNDNSKEEKLAFDFTRKVLLLVTILEKHPFLEVKIIQGKVIH